MAHFSASPAPSIPGWGWGCLCCTAPNASPGLQTSMAGAHPRSSPRRPSHASLSTWIQPNSLAQVRHALLLACPLASFALGSSPYSTLSFYSPRCSFFSAPRFSWPCLFCRSGFTWQGASLLRQGAGYWVTVSFPAPAPPLWPQLQRHGNS